MFNRPNSPMGRRFGFGQQMQDPMMPNPTQQMPQQRNGLPFQGGGFQPPGQMMRPQVMPEMPPEQTDPNMAPPGLLASVMQKPMQMGQGTQMQDRRMPGPMGGLMGKLMNRQAMNLPQPPQGGLRRRFGFGGMR